MHIYYISKNTIIFEMSVTNLLAVLGMEDYLVSLQAREHEVLADEPADLGGNDQGLTPYELILGG
ncbi:OsmC family protein, partial [Aphanothece microscopica]|uniref:OsmC family protein n=1 Tax=Aphanothece microscopica TaxID=1049561 RepID=UPI003984C591